MQNEIKRSETKGHYDFAISLKYSNSIMNKSRAIFVIVTFEKGKIDIWLSFNTEIANFT